MYITKKEFGDVAVRLTLMILMDMLPAHEWTILVLQSCRASQTFTFPIFYLRIPITFYGQVEIAHDTRLYNEVLC